MEVARCGGMHNIALHVLQSTQSTSHVQHCTGPAGPPSKLQHVCVGILSNDHERLNISWEPLPCHLQNGADIKNYSIQYRRASDSHNQVNTISSSDGRLDCVQESNGPYRCVTKVVADSTGLQQNQKYIFQVSAVNGHGFGPYSDPVSATPGILIHNGKLNHGSHIFNH